MSSDQTAATLSSASSPASLPLFTATERETLRMLAARVAALAARSVEDEKRALWYQHNALEVTRPLIFCDPENGWGEIITPADLLCESTLGQQWEMRLRKELFWGEQMRDDRVIEPFFDVGYVYEESDWGMHEIKTGGQDGGSYVWEAPLKSYDDLDKLRGPEIAVDYAATERVRALAEETLGDLLTVRVKSAWWWSLGMTWLAINLRGLNQIMLDMMDAPEDLHRLMAFLRDGHLAKLDSMEQQGLLSPNHDGTYVGSGGFGWTHELPQPDYQGRVRTMDMWGFCESQETVLVSPRMFGEFVLPYQLPILERFGLNCYGCCEPLDKRWPYIEQIPRLRRVSVSAWANVADMAEKLQDRYIYSWKPTPADLAMPSFDEEHIRRSLRAMIQATRNCRVEIIMKDNHTICHDPQRVVRWAQIAREEAERL